MRDPHSLRRAVIRSIAIGLVCSVELACASGEETLDSAAIDRLTQSCVANTELAEPVCRCVAERASKDLSSDGFELIIALLEQDKEEARRLRGKLSQTDALEANVYMARTPQECIEELREP